MKRVYKYKLEIQDHQVVSLPKGARILSVANQREDIVLYAEVDDEQKGITDIDIFIHGTGHVMNENANLFLGTVLLREGYLVFHVFANKE